jgi:CDP-diacylglycerol--serine O-phosphatidyltransferase
VTRPRVRYLAPNGVTVANIACGFIAIVVAADGRFETAVYLLVVAIVLDTLDGSIARWLHATSEFGQEMDSFSDALSFGAAPAFLVYQAELRHLGPEGLILALIYLVCAVLRLSRFNLTTDAHLKDRSTVGVPVPVAASYLMVAVLMRDQVSGEVVAAVTLIMALLMVSSVALPNLKGRSVVTVMLMIGILNYLAVIVRPCWATIIWWNAWNAAILTVARIQNRRLDPSIS